MWKIRAVSLKPPWPCLLLCASLAGSMRLSSAFTWNINVTCLTCFPFTRWRIEHFLGKKNVLYLCVQMVSKWYVCVCVRLVYLLQRCEWKNKSSACYSEQLQSAKGSKGIFRDRVSLHHVNALWGYFPQSPSLSKGRPSLTKTLSLKKKTSNKYIWNGKMRLVFT